MLRRDLVQAAKTLQDMIDKLGLRELLEPHQRERGPGTKPNPAVMEHARHYFVARQGFGSVEVRLLKLLDLEFLDSDEFWTMLLIGETPTQTYRKVMIASELLTKFLPLVSSSAVESILQARQKEVHPTLAILTVIVLEKEASFSTPLRLSIMLQSVADMYEACSLIEGVKAELSVIACDSGSDKSFDFLGAAKIVECVKEVILSLWDRVVFFRERQVSSRVELVAQALPVLDRIAEMQQTQRLGPEQAELLRRQIVNGCTKFVESGSMIPEVTKASSFDPRRLLSPAPKLLVAANEAVTAEQPSSAEPASANDVLDTLTDEERAALRKLVEKARNREVQS